MLAGYFAFKDGNREMARASLDLISRGVRPDGLLSLCFPAGRDYPIPFYTLAYFFAGNHVVFAPPVAANTARVPHGHVFDKAHVQRAVNRHAGKGKIVLVQTAYSHGIYLNRIKTNL